jgi:hypothetical protein
MERWCLLGRQGPLMPNGPPMACADPSGQLRKSRPSPKQYKMVSANSSS